MNGTISSFLDQHVRVTQNKIVYTNNHPVKLVVEYKTAVVEFLDTQKVLVLKQPVVHANNSYFDLSGFESFAPLIHHNLLIKLPPVQTQYNIARSVAIIGERTIRNPTVLVHDSTIEILEGDTTCSIVMVQQPAIIEFPSNSQN